jgi:hypothetical protein
MTKHEKFYQVSIKADIWSVGTVLVQVLSDGKLFVNEKILLDPGTGDFPFMETFEHYREFVYEKIPAFSVTAKNLMRNEHLKLWRLALVSLLGDGHLSEKYQM